MHSLELNQNQMKMLGGRVYRINLINANRHHTLNFNGNGPIATSEELNPRIEESTAIRNKFPTKVPIIIERYSKDQTLPILDKRKFLVPQEITLSQFLSIIKGRMKLQPNIAIFFIVKNRSMVSLSKTIAETYMEYKDPDGFLYITYASQEAFGH